MRFRTIVALACCLLAYPAAAHRLRDSLEAAATAPAEGAPVEQISGIVHRVTIDDRVAGIVVQVISLEQDDGKAVLLQSAQAAELVAESRVEVTGRRNGNALFASGIRTLADAGQRGPQNAKPAARAEGKLALLHSDYFAEGRSEFLFEVHGSGGEITALRFHVVPEALQRGMQVAVEGHASADTTGLVPDTVTILALPPAGNQKAIEKAVTTNNALVILMTFSDSPAVPFTPANVQAVFAGGPGSGSVVEYFKEASFGQQLLNATITGWLPTNVPAPAGCDWTTMGTLGRSAAVAAGYSPTSYQNLLYVFPSVGACGWAGLAYVGANGVWINGRNATSVYGHELGHNLGLLHAASLRCSGVAIGGSCSASEYGDPFDIMGNQSAMHFNAAQKLDLGWITAGTVATYGTGTATYVLNPIEIAGGSLYALKIAAAANRTYWLEYRQPIGFDAALSNYPNNGAQIRVASPFETLCPGCDSWSNDTELLDMTPGTASFTDAALVVGQTFTDSVYGISIAVLGATGTALTVRVSTPSAIVSTTTSLASSLNPASAGVAVTFTATVVGNVPSGTVSFADSGSGIAGCGGVAMVGTGNTRTASCTSSGLVPGAHSIAATYSGDAGNNGSSSAALSQVINAVSGSAAWVDDALPAGAIAAGYAEGWNWTSTNPSPFSGGLAHQSALVAGVHQHYFYNAASPLAVGVGDTLFAYVYLDPVNPPTEVMLQWNDGTWEHRAYWGANQIGWGTDGTISSRYMGALPATGQWVRLAVPAANVGLEGRAVNGMAFTLYGGRATWDFAGK